MIVPIVVAEWPESRSAAELFYCLPPGVKFLLESQAGPTDITRYSFLGVEPFMSLSARGNELLISIGSSQATQTGDPLLLLEDILTRYASVCEPGLPSFTGGAVGYFSYELGAYLEPAVHAHTKARALPDLHLAFYDHLVAIDHRAQKAYAIATPLPGREAQSLQAAQRLARLVREGSPTPVSTPAATGTSHLLKSNFTRQGYAQAVTQAKAYIAAGDIYQVNLSQQFSLLNPDATETVYERLRQANPAPFAAFLYFDEKERIVSASPERFLSYDPLTRRVETRPIKGTRPRGQTPAEDALLKDELINSEKDKAELVMIVDLERNDLGRVCDYGSVHVSDLRRVEPYPTVWHTVATIEGRLRQNASRADLLRATFPGGSITGAPKIRAMQIIDELETVSRDVYCGAMGYLSFDGHIDLNIAIRTILFEGQVARFNAGGGIVADSEPEAEYEETLHKARALARALNANLSSF